MKKIIALCVILSTWYLHASLDIECAKSSIITLLQQHSPALIKEFKSLCRRYDRIVTNFFDTNNADPLKTHINYMEAELQTFEKLCHDTRFASAHALLTTYYEEIKNLVVLLKQYIGSRNALSMALNVRHYKFLLPRTIRTRGDLALLKGLTHRLRC